jgi:tripartite-type tricarboxylate transporter receptor subunit TctC
MAPLKIGVACVAGALVIAAPLALPQTYPSKPIRIIVPFPAGGTSDTVPRLIAQKLADRFGQPVIVENRPGGDTLIGTEAVAKALPDGYTVLSTSSSAITVLPHTRKRLPYDPFKDFVHVVQTTYVQFVLAVNPSVPAANVAELVALARSKPGKLTYASGSASGYITGEMFKLATGTDIVSVPYKGAAPATTDLLSGQVNMMFATFGIAIPYFKAKRLNALAVTGEKRSPALPDVPTMAEAGVKDFESNASWGFSVPRGTPPDIVRKLNGEVSAVLRMPDIVDKILAQGVEPRSGTPEEYTALLRAEFENYRILLPRIGIRPE